MNTIMRERIDAIGTMIKAYGGAFLIIVILLTWAAFPAFATNKSGGDVEAEATSKAIAGASASAESITFSEGGAGFAEGGQGGASSAVNEGIEVDASDQSRIENNSSNVVLVPNNNTESCLRVWGLGWGNASGSGGIGIPVRSKKCDYEQAADDAFAAGERDLGWFWKCENANLYKSFKDRGESKESAKIDCFDKMVGGVRATETISTMTKMIESLMEESRRQQKIYKEQSDLISQSCDEANDRVFAACAGK